MVEMRNTFRGKLKRNSLGSTLVEFAVVFTVLFTLIFGVIDFARAVYSYHYVANAAREATRWASIRGNASCTTNPRTFPSEVCPAGNTEVTNFVKTKLDASGIYVNAAATPTDAGYLGVTPTWDSKKGDGSNCINASSPSADKSKDVGCTIKVLVQYNFGFSLPFLPSATNIVVKSTSKFTISQ
jgi:Flp pilus assembly protein TadG